MALKYTSFAETSIFDSQTLPRTWVLIPFWLDFDMKVVVIFFTTNGNPNKCCLQLFLQHCHLNYLTQSRPSSLHQTRNEFEFCFRQQVLRLHHSSQPQEEWGQGWVSMLMLHKKTCWKSSINIQIGKRIQIYYFLASFSRLLYWCNKKLDPWQGD